MATPKPFLFDNQTFEDGNDSATASNGVSKPIYTQEQMDLALQTAMETSAQEAHAAAMATIDADMQNTLRRLDAELLNLAAREVERINEMQKSAIDTGLMIVRKMLPNLAEANALDSIADFIQRVLTERFDEQRLVVRVSPTILEPLKERIDQLSAASSFGGKMILLPEPTLAVPDCRVEWADGGAERDTARLYQDIEQAVQQFLIQGTGKGSANLPEENPISSEEIDSDQSVFNDDPNNSTSLEEKADG